MIDLRYKFPDQQTMLDLLAPLGMTYADYDDNPQVSQGGHQYALYEVGEIPGVDGWHLNIRLIDEDMDLSSLEPFIVVPKNPKNVWA